MAFPFDPTDPAHVRRWMAALNEGARKAPRCGAMTKLGVPCQKLRLIGGDRCRHHVHGKQRDELDARRELRLQRIAAGGASSCQGRRGEADARKALFVIRRRRLLRAWRKDPTIPGSTIELTPVDEARVGKLLDEEFNIAFDRPLPGS